jgi:beta-lactamase class D
MFFPFIIWTYYLFFMQDSLGPVRVEIDLDSLFQVHDVEGCFAVLDEADHKLLEYHPHRCREGFSPKSTFKIPHALIALEEGVLRDENQVIRWDGTPQPVESWNQDQTLSTAIQYSCVWFFSELTTRIDPLTYQDYLRKFDYGNQEVSGPPAHYWLYGGLRISAEQQVDFLRRFYHQQLGISDRSIRKVKALILLEKNEDYELNGKTGGGPVEENKNIMWLVGYVKKPENVYFFAMNFTCPEFNRETADARMEIVRATLKKLKII